MLFSEMRSGFRSVLRELKVESSLFDFAESIDAAIMFFALNLPEDSVHNLIKVYNADPSADNSRVLPLPDGLLKIESVQIAKSRDINDVPIYIPATIVNQRQFLNAVQYSNEAMISTFNGVINYNPEVAAIVEDAPGAINLVYRSRPKTFISKFRGYATGALVAVLDQVPGQNNSFITETVGQTWEELGLDADKLVGGSVLIKNGTRVYVGDIVHVWEDTGFSGLHVSEEILMPYITSGGANISYVTERPELISTSRYLPDHESTDINEVFHHLLVDYAIGRFLLSRKPEASKGFMQNVYQVFQALGVNMKNEFGGEEE